MANQTLSLPAFKRCKRCGVDKSMDHFSSHATSKFGKRPDCKQCEAERARSRRKNNLDVRARGLKQSRDWYQSNRDKAIADAKVYNLEHASIRQEQKLKSAFGLTLHEYDQILVKQDYGCAICKRTEARLGKALAVDHDHRTGKIRGLLCKDCNTGIGLLQDRYDYLNAAAAYLKEHK